MNPMPEQERGDAYHGAILATDGVEEVELIEPAKALGQAGAKVTVIAPHGGRIQAFNHFDKGDEIPVDLTFDEADPQRYDALMPPGGARNADTLRVEPPAQGPSGLQSRDAQALLADARRCAGRSNGTQ